MKSIAVRKPSTTELRLEPFLQSYGHCGAASLKIALAYFGKNVSEKRLARLSGTTPTSGVDHAGLIAAAKKIGATAREKRNASIADLRHLVHVKRIPVIVGWQSPLVPGETMRPDGTEPEEHYSVVSAVTRTHVRMYDPNMRSGRRSLPIKIFLKHWWDTGKGPRDIVRRWMIAVEVPERSRKRKTAR
ncbi:MAG: hypothetical protein RLZZ324_1048 [Candidatus Parcubacteria bacterium]|jgi:ABC-type bacteriocin/lantibiotic exporter with double-glycine peptidase domain